MGKDKTGNKAIHWQGGQIKRVCITCGKVFYVDRNVIKNGRGKFCSRSCTGKRKYGRKQLAPKKELYCIICDKKFYEYVSRLLKEKNRGKCCSKECRVKYTQQRISGARNYRWKGGITKHNLLLRYQMKARNWSKAVKIRDKYICRLCGDKNYKGRGKSIKLESHHLKSWKDYPELRYDINNGITTCYDCHKKILKGIIIDEIIYKVLDKKADLMNACLEMLKK
jgi:5-methylcytosine-specific restriction endonuclease McrA